VNLHRLPVAQRHDVQVLRLKGKARVSGPAGEPKRDEDTLARVDELLGVGAKAVDDRELSLQEALDALMPSKAASKAPISITTAGSSASRMNEARPPPLAIASFSPSYPRRTTSTLSRDIAQRTLRPTVRQRNGREADG
jgi:hypothetical protein